MNRTHPHAKKEAVPVGGRDRAAARTFYCGVLGGRQVPPVGIGESNGRLRFRVGSVLIETGPAFRDAHTRLILAAKAAEDVAVRCWDAGFSVHVRGRRRGRCSLALVDPFGRYIDLVPNDHDLR